MNQPVTDVGEEDPRPPATIAEHARIVQEELQVAQSRAYIGGPNYVHDDGTHPKLPGFRNDLLGQGSAALQVFRENPRGDEVRNIIDHVRFLEHVVERLAAQVAELAEGLAGE